MADEKKPKGEQQQAKPKGGDEAREGRQGRQGRRKAQGGGDAAASAAVVSTRRGGRRRACIEKYKSEVIPALTKQFSYKNPNAGPAPRRRSSSTWASAPPSRTRRSSTPPSRSCSAITGQKPVVTRAKKAIANFKLRAGHPHRRDGHAPPRAHVGVPRPPRHASRCRARATSRASRARRSTARATTRSASRSRSSSPRSTTTRSTSIKGLEHHLRDHGDDRRGGARAPPAARHALPGSLIGRGRDQWPVLLSSRN